jgi:quercetin dioxygenase-like cupin family protein
VKRPNRNDAGLPAALLDRIACGMKPIEPRPEQRDRLRQRVLQQARNTSPEGTKTLRADDSPWIQISPYVEMRLLVHDEAAGTHTSLMRMRPGGVVPTHRHTKAEEFIVLEGECHIGTHRLGAGDVHLSEAGSWHDPVTTSSGVLVLVRGEYPPPSTRL